MYFLAKLHCTDPSQFDVPNLYVLRLEEITILELEAYVAATVEVEHVAKQFDGAVAGVSFEFTGDFLRVSDEQMNELGFKDDGELENILFDTEGLHLFDGIEESDEITCHQVTVWPEGGLYFSCMLDTLGFTVDTQQVHISTFTGDIDDGSDEDTH